MTSTKGDGGNRKLIDRLIAKPQHGPRLGVVGTTYEFDPEFFEIDFLPTLLELGAWDDRSWSSRIAVEKALAELEAAVIFPDARCYRGRPHSLRVEIQPVEVGPGAKLHAKVLVIVHEAAVRLVVGSANLTENGFRKNREVVAVVDATPKDPAAAALLRGAIQGFDATLATGRSESVDRVLGLARERLDSWGAENTTDEQEWFQWSGRSVRLWREFLRRWPQGEPVERVTIVSPFWSPEESDGPIAIFLGALAEAGGAAPGGLELRLLTEAKTISDGAIVPSFGAGLPHVPTDLPGLRATAHAVYPAVAKDEIDVEGFSALRPLHAKVVLLEGANTSLAYLGSANFSRHGWGFGGGIANIEAGIVVRRTGKHRQSLTAIIPATVGEPVVLTGDWAKKVAVEQSSAEQLPWPSFVRAVRLVPSPDAPDRLDLEIEVDAEEVKGDWSVGFAGEIDAGAAPLAQGRERDASPPQVALEPRALERLLRDKEVLVRWWACPSGREFPVNVAFDARDGLPVAPGAGRPGEALLLGYYQGRISFEEMFPPPPGEGFGVDSPDASVERSGVDTSRIQSYQVREFVEALPGILADIGTAKTSGASIRLALLGPVSPVALAREIARAANENRRTPVAAGFQLVEIMSCLFQAESFPVPEKHEAIWREHCGKAIREVDQLLSGLKSAFPDDLMKGSSFVRYEKTLRRSSRREGRGA